MRRQHRHTGSNDASPWPDRPDRGSARQTWREGSRCPLPVAGCRLPVLRGSPGRGQGERSEPEHEDAGGTRYPPLTGGGARLCGCRVGTARQEGRFHEDAGGTRYPPLTGGGAVCGLGPRSRRQSSRAQGVAPRVDGPGANDSESQAVPRCGRRNFALRLSPMAPFLGIAYRAPFAFRPFLGNRVSRVLRPSPMAPRWRIGCRESPIATLV